MRIVNMGFPRLDEIRIRREAMGMSLKKFAELIDVKPNFLSMIETRKANPNFNLLEKIFLTLDQEEQHVLKGIKTVGQFSKKLRSVSKSDSLTEVFNIMQKNDFSQLPVFSNSRCVGMVTEHSISKYFLENPGPLDAHVGVEEIMDFPPPIIDFNFKITSVLLEFLIEHDCFLVSENGKITSLITKIDAIRSLIKQ
jgi:predicted transcriptional regulator